MELPRRARGDELLEPGALARLRARLRRVARTQDLTTVIACAFDHRTRMLPFIYADTRMVPAGVRAIGSAMVDAGFSKTRIVLQQWNRSFRPSLMQIDGRIPDLFMVSTMGMHQEMANELIRDARRIDARVRPLIIAGGSHAVYEPGFLFNANPESTGGADVAVTGEEFVLLSMLEVLLSMRARNESMRSAFFRARDSGALDDIPGLIYPHGDRDGVAEELVDTGIQRLLGDLDELPDPTLGYRILEAPSRSTKLARQALSARKVARYSPISSLVLTFGCKFACPYCPIPAYNQRQHRVKSGQRVAEDFWRIHEAFGIRYFFGVDDNFFNHKARTLEIIEAMASAEFNGVPLRQRIRWGTEVTVHDTLQMKEHLPLVAKAGVRALWLGVEDMTAAFINKGQTVDKTCESFRLMVDAGISPMPMMMHHDSQPLFSKNGNYGLLNQVRLLRKAGAVSLQVLMMTPSTGSKLFESAFETGQVLDRVGGRKVEMYMHDGNYVVASTLARPWRKQLNMLISYLYFYNPVWMVVYALGRKTRLRLKPAGMQIVGMMGLAHSFRRTFGWALRLMFRKIHRLKSPRRSTIPMHGVDGSLATHEIEKPLAPTIRGRAIPPLVSV